MVWPRSVHAARSIVDRLVQEEGELEYHGGRWRNEVSPPPSCELCTQ